MFVKEGLINKFRSNKLNSDDKFTFVSHMKEIAKTIGKIFSKNGIEGLQSFSEADQLKYIEMSSLVDEVKAKRKQENTLKQTV